MFGIAIFAAIFGHVTAFCRTLVPVVGIVICPCGCPCVGMGRFTGLRMVAISASTVLHAVVFIVPRAKVVLFGTDKNVSAGTHNAVIGIINFAAVAVGELVVFRICSPIVITAQCASRQPLAGRRSTRAGMRHNVSTGVALVRIGAEIVCAVAVLLGICLLYTSPSPRD